MLEKIRNMEESISEKDHEISVLQKKLKKPEACGANEGSDFCKCCKYSYEYDGGNALFPLPRTGCTLTVTCEDFEMKEE